MELSQFSRKRHNALIARAPLARPVHLSRPLLHFYHRFRDRLIGRTSAFGAEYPGSSPGPGANAFPLTPRLVADCCQTPYRSTVSLSTHCATPTIGHDHEETTPDGEESHARRSLPDSNAKFYTGALLLSVPLGLIAYRVGKDCCWRQKRRPCRIQALRNALLFPMSDQSGRSASTRALCLDLPKSMPRCPKSLGVLPHR